MGDKNEKTNLKFKILEGKNKVKEKEREKATNLNKIVIFEKVNSWFAQREREREKLPLASFFFFFSFSV